MGSLNRLDGAAWWVSGQVVLVVVCLRFLWRAFGTQLYFEPTDEAVTQAYAHHPEFVAAMAAIVIAIVGGIVQIRMKARAPGRLICLAATGFAIATLLAVGGVVTGTGLPTAATT